MYKVNSLKTERNKINSNFVCPHCERIIDNFKKHAFKDVVNCLCNVCDLAIPNEQCVTEHIKLVHESPTEYISCNECSIDFSSKKFSNIHNLICHLDDLNSKLDQLETKSEVPEMKEKLKAMEIHECDYCDVLLPKKEDLLKHMTDAKHMESKCDYEIEMEVDENENIAKAFKCDRCDQSFGLATQLMKHRFALHTNIKHATEKLKPKETKSRVLYMTIIDDSEVQIIEDLSETPNDNQSQEIVMSGEKQKQEETKNFDCQHCNKTFTRKEYLSMHKKNIHKDQFNEKYGNQGEPIKFSCNKCDKTFSRNASLVEHFDFVHNGIKNTCNKCGSSFTRKRDLRRHIDVSHNGLKFFECKILMKDLVGFMNLKVTTVKCMQVIQI